MFASNNYYSCNKKYITYSKSPFYYKPSFIKQPNLNNLLNVHLSNYNNRPIKRKGCKACGH